MEMLVAYGLLIFAGLYTGTATWYRASNSKKELKLKEADIRLHILSLRKKYGDELKSELDEIVSLIDN